MFLSQNMLAWCNMQVNNKEGGWHSREGYYHRHRLINVGSLVHIVLERLFAVPHLRPMLLPGTKFEAGPAGGSPLGHLGHCSPACGTMRTPCFEMSPYSLPLPG